MYLTIFFWLALFFPGYAIARRFFPDEVESGIVGTIAVSFFLTLAILSPFSIASYVLRLPVSAFGLVIVAAIVAAGVDLVASRAWRPIVGMMSWPVAIGLSVLAIDAAVGMLVGGHVMGDARIHLARIRFLVDHGFSNVDPFVGHGYFYPIYHTNLLHALYAACVNFTGVDQVAVWWVSLGWAKLLVTSGAYYLGFSVFQKRLAGWAAALFSLVIWGSVPYVLYPNKIAPLFVCAVMFGVAVRILATGCTWRRCVLLAIGSLLLGEIHSLYGAFAALALAPPLAVRGVHAWVRGRAGGHGGAQAARWMAALLCLAPAGPFLAVSVLKASPNEQSAQANDEDVADEAPAANIHHFADGSIMYRPDRAFGNYWWYGLPLFIAAAALALRRSDRAGVVALLSIMAVVAAVLFIPPLCSELLALTGREWIVSRFSFVLRLAVVAIVAGSLGTLVDAHIRPLALRGAVLLVIVLAAVPYGARHGPLSWQAYAEKLSACNERQARAIGGARAVEAFVDGKIEPGTTVLTTPRDAVPLVMVVDCFVVAASSSNNGVPDLAQRLDDIDVMLDGTAPLARRAALLKKYDVRSFLSTSGTSPRWPGNWVKEHWFQKPWLIVEFNRHAIGG